MPRIRVESMVGQFDADLRGATRSTDALVSDAAGLAAGIGAYAGQQAELRKADAERGRRELLAAQQRQEEDEAKLYTVNAVGRVQERAMTTLSEAEQTGTMPGVTDRLLKSYADWEKEEDAGAPPRAKGMLAEQLARMRFGVHERAFTAETLARQHGLESDYLTGADADGRMVWAEPDTFSQALARRRAVLDVLNLPQETKDKLWLKTRAGLATQAAYGRAERDPEAVLRLLGFNPANPVQRLKNSGAEAIQADPAFSQLPDDQLQLVLHRSQTLVSQKIARREADGDRRLRNAEAMIGGVRDVLMAGKRLSPEYSQAAAAAVAGTPYEKALGEMLKGSAERTSFALQPLKVQEQALLAEHAQANQGADPKRLKRIAEAQQVHDQQVKDFGADPLVAGVEYGLIDRPAPLDTSSWAGVVDGMRRRMPQAQAVESHVGKPVSPLTRDEAGAVSAMLASMPPRDRAQAVAVASQVLGPAQAGALAQQFEKITNGGALPERAVGYAFAMQDGKTTAGRLRSELVLKGADAMRTGTSTKVENPVFGVPPARWAGVLSSQLEGFPDQAVRQQITEAATLIAHGIASEQGGKLGRDDLDRALRLAVGGTLVPRGVPITSDGKRTTALIPLPAGKTEDDLDAAIEAMTPQTLAAGAAPLPMHAPGMVEGGNIDLSKRPVVRNADGSISTVRSIGVEFDGKEILLPTVSEDGKILTEQQAIEQYRRTGKHLGKFSTVDAANAYAEAIHRQQESAQFVIAGGARVPVEQFLRDLLPVAPLVPVRQGVYAPQVGGRSVMRPDGSRVTVDLR